ncbi:DUF938 domain-containing protein [Thalassomonas actiniarum]|uniref:DUF938 domain-containing protein n=1 Tax=Thalassomonas actiniarum TaxID=485447 RepID=A0AAF0C1E2_9GAMM|nr:DUF938 domain-containing protein [Thalassomonas actiniarum]WDD98901.1 DUF938 domain-containing protein [Thalassomonas actiniarum]
MLNFSPSCERNQGYILTELEQLFAPVTRVLELGSLSGQHALHFASGLPHLNWQPSDLAENVPALTENIRHSAIDNCLVPIALDVTVAGDWPEQQYDGIFTANTLHIMSWPSVVQMFDHLPKVCRPGTLLTIYGPFKYQGAYTSDSNASFQQWLQDRDPQSGIRDFEQVGRLARQQGFELISDIQMPANNQLISWQKQG